jgi:hypothetical protein
MSFGVIAATAITTGAAAVSANQQKKAAARAAKAGEQQPVNIADVSAKAENQAERNISRSIALEDQYDPYVAQARRTAAINFNKSLGEDPLSAKSKELALGMANGPVQQYDSPAIREAVAQALAASRGPAIPYAELPVEVSNMATRKALATAGRTGGGLSLGRDLVARDLGLTSLQLGQQAETNRNNRIAQLLGVGGAELGMNEGNAQFGVQQRLSNINNLSTLGGRDFDRSMSAAQFTQGLKRPEVGLDPTAIANLATGNASTANQNRTNNANAIMNQANINSQMYGQIAGSLGSGVSGYLNRPKKGTAKGTLDVGAMY